MDNIIQWKTIKPGFLSYNIWHSSTVRYREMIESYFHVVEIDEFLRNTSKYSSGVQGVLTYEMD